MTGPPVMSPPPDAEGELPGPWDHGGHYNVHVTLRFFTLHLPHALWPFHAWKLNPSQLLVSRQSCRSVARGIARVDIVAINPNK